ncbi:MAG: hypothetical protein BGO01_13615 [Armatimonadetes bacterium 55-13]|nr:hypothetical protein [Armatimonadota bacterium]OJU64766.1 MAG: hypothetical protein BGO01_13615 [Armatimonadetes bacterium 55-13]
MKLRLSILVALVAVAAFAAFAPKPLFVNGKKATKGTIEQNGETYIPASALYAAGAEVSIGKDKVSVQFKPVRAQNEQAYVEGLIDEWVTSGSWRIKVSNLEKIENPGGSGGDGFAIDFEAKNVSKKMAQIAYTGVQSVQLVDSEDHRYVPTSSSFPGYYADIQPGGGFKNRLELAGENVTAGEPTKLIIQFAKPDKSIRINLKP